MSFEQKYKKYKNKYLKLKSQLGGSNSLSFENSRMLENCNLCFNNSVIYLFYSIPEFKKMVLELDKINNTNKKSSSKVEKVDINELFLYLKDLFKKMNKETILNSEIGNENFVLCNKEYTKFIKNFYILAINNLGENELDYQYYFDRLDNKEMGFLNVSLQYFLIVFSDIIDKIFTYYVDDGEKVYFIEDGAPISKFNKYLIRPPFKKIDNPGEFDYINIQNYKIEIGGNNYKLVGILRGNYISPQETDDGLTEGPGDHYWFDIYNERTNNFTRINDLEISIVKEIEKQKTDAISWLIYEKQ
jgi:hypothetical protein